jgi:hypothetical protein
VATDDMGRCRFEKNFEKISELGLTGRSAQDTISLSGRTSRLKLTKRGKTMARKNMQAVNAATAPAVIDPATLNGTGVVLNGMAAAPANGTAPTDPNAPADDATDAVVLKIFATRSEAEAAKPAKGSKHLKPFEAKRNGTVIGWVLARGYENGLSILARIDGYTVSTGPKQIAKDAIADALASMTDADRAALLAKYMS